MLGLVFILALNFLIHKVIPEPDNETSSLMLTTEIIGQVVLTLVGVLLLHRTIDYIPTFSGQSYDPLHLTSCILIMFTIILNTQTKVC